MAAQPGVTQVVPRQLQGEAGVSNVPAPLYYADSGKPSLNNVLAKFSNFLVTLFLDSFISLFGSILFIFKSSVFSPVLCVKRVFCLYPAPTPTVSDSGVPELGRRENGLFLSLVLVST